MNEQFGEISDEAVEVFLKQNGFMQVRKLETGEWIGLMRLAFTMSVCCGIDDMTPFRYRWCFSELAEALHFFAVCKSVTEVPEEDRRHSLAGHRYFDKPLLVLYNEVGLPRW